MINLKIFMFADFAFYTYDGGLKSSLADVLSAVDDFFFFIQARQRQWKKCVDHKDY